MLNKRIFSAFVLVLGLYALLAQPVAAATVDNPGNVTMTAIVIAGIGDLMVELPAATLAGSIDANGNLTIPASGIRFQDLVFDIPIVGTLTIRLQTPGGATGRLNPITGDGTVAVGLTVSAQNALIPAGCQIGPITLNLTTGTSGGLQGVPYDMGAGVVAYVTNDFGIPRSSGCGLLADLLDQVIGLPLSAGVAYIVMEAAFSPVLTGS